MTQNSNLGLTHERTRHGSERELHSRFDVPDAVGIVAAVATELAKHGGLMTGGDERQLLVGNRTDVHLDVQQIVR
jgi:hypothetical protein